MADPLSITGLAIAVVQGGFQLYASLSEYLDAVDARFEELDFARRQAMDMRRSLEIIDQLAPRLASKHAASSSSLESFLRSCEVDIKVLNDLLLELSGPGLSGEGLRHRLHRVQIRAKKLTFPFNRSKIDRLEKRLAIVNGSLSTALNTANLEVSLVTQDQVSDMHHLLTVMVGTNTSAAQIVSSTQAMSYPSRSRCGPDSIDQRNAMLQLVSKPAYLKSTIDELRAYSQEPFHNSCTLSDAVCFCRPRRKLTRQRQVWSAFALSSEKLSSASHAPDCQFAGLTGNRETFGVTFEYTGFRTVFQKAIQLSFSLTFGAGGLSVSPGISYAPVVDDESAPAFRLVHLLRKIQTSSYREFCSDIHNGLEMIMNHIFQLYRQGKASPRDTDKFGRSLVHRLVQATISIHLIPGNEKNKDIVTLTLASVKRLVASGVPAMAHDHEGQSSAMYCLDNVYLGDGLRPKLATSLISAEPDRELLSRLQSYNLRADDTRREVFAQWPILAEAASYGQLFSATVTGNEAAVATILATRPSALRESNIFGQVPLHIAVQHPSCLQLLIKAAGADKSLLNVLDAYSRTPLDYVMNDRGPESLESLRLLLEADCAIWQTRSRDLDTSWGKWQLYIDALKDRREKLKQLAIEVFNGEEIQLYGLEKQTVLDGNAAVVWRLLLDKGITVTQALSPVRRDSERRNYTMYHLVYSTGLLEDLWTLGFRDINMLDDEGMPPLMNWRRDVFDGGYETRCEWLVNHGANLEEPLRREGRIGMEAQPIAVCHNLFRLLGINFLGYKNREALYRAEHGPTSPLPEFLTHDLTTGQTMIEKLLSIEVDDACGCTCSREGCTSFVWFLKYLPAFANGRRKSYQMFDWRWSEGTQPDWLADPIKVFTKAFGSIMSQDHLSDAVRCLTHAALGVKHTCCEAAVMRSPVSLALDPYNRQHMSTEEKDELESEQASLIDLLDNLVAEFEAKSQENRDGAPLWRADPAEFWSEVWASRMNGIIEDLDGSDLTSEEIRAAEEIGVEWKSPKPERPPSTKRRRDWLTFEEFKEEVDRIMSDCK